MTSSASSSTTTPSSSSTSSFTPHSLHRRQDSTSSSSAQTVFDKTVPPPRTPQDIKRATTLQTREIQAEGHTFTVLLIGPARNKCSIEVRTGLNSFEGWRSSQHTRVRKGPLKGPAIKFCIEELSAAIRKQQTEALAKKALPETKPKTPGKEDPETKTRTQREEKTDQEKEIFDWVEKTLSSLDESTEFHPDPKGSVDEKAKQEFLFPTADSEEKEASAEEQEPFTMIEDSEMAFMMEGFEIINK